MDEALQEITCEEAAILHDAVWIDVREKHEWDAGHVPDAIHLPLSELVQTTQNYKAPEDKFVILYCQRGMRSMQAADILQRAGFTDIYSLKGGYGAWQKKA